MYQDPTQIRKRYGSVNLDDYEAKLVDALVAYTGGEKAVLLRTLIIERAVEILGDAGMNSDGFSQSQRSA